MAECRFHGTRILIDVKDSFIAQVFGLPDGQVARASLSESFVAWAIDLAEFTKAQDIVLPDCRTMSFGRIPTAQASISELVIRRRVGNEHSATHIPIES